MFVEDNIYEDKALQAIKGNDIRGHRTYQKYEQPTSKVKQFFNKLDEEHNSEDEGIQDYKIGGYHPTHIGEVLINRYVVIQKLGWGHFSTVWLCKDFKYNTYVAVKIQKSSPHYMDAALDEVQILQKIQKHYNDPKWNGKTRDDTHVVGLLNAFVYKTFYGNHFCMVFEILRCNLLDVLKRYDYEGVPLDICQQMSKQILKGLDYLHRVCGIIHTDLKPENVMLCLTDQQMKEIVENGQLQNHELFQQRIKKIQQYLGITSQDKIQKENKIIDLEQKLNNQNLTKNQKKNLKKRIRKEKQKENVNQQSQTYYAKNENKRNLEQIFDVKRGKISLNQGGKLKLPIRVKIADLGNACWKHHYFSTQIQTRQYRSPQVILGQNYNETADIWSFGCMMYQMLTGDLLFQPKKGENWGKNDDHLAQMQELLGCFDKNFICRSPKMRRYFNKNAVMKKFPQLNHYPLHIVMQLKNGIQTEVSKQFSEFLIPTLIAEPEKRISALNALNHPWLKIKISDSIEFKMSQAEHNQIKKRFYADQQSFRIQTKLQTENEASCEDNADSDQNFSPLAKKSYKVCDIRLIDRSFTDLGYIGYCQGIDLEKLDSCKNWQF